MPGMYARDSLAPNLLTGVTLNAAATDTGDVWEAQWPGKFSLELVTGTVTGTSPTMDVEVQASDESDFSGGVVSLGRFARVGDEDNETRRMLFDSNGKRYIRLSVVIGGTSPVFTGSTVTPHLQRDHWVETQSA